MKSRMSLSIALLLSVLPVSITYADTPVAKDSEETCQNRINAFKSSLEAIISADAKNANAKDVKQDVDAAKAELARINNLPSSLTPCEKQRQIPSLSSDGAFRSKPESEAVNGRKTSP